MERISRLRCQTLTSVHRPKKMAGAPRSTRHPKLLASAANDLARLDARGAHVQLAHGARRDLRAHRLNVRIPPAVGPPVRVGHAHAESRTLATHVTYGSHAEHHLSKILRPADGPIRADVTGPTVPGNLPRVLTLRRAAKSVSDLDLARAAGQHSDVVGWPRSDHPGAPWTP